MVSFIPRSAFLCLVTVAGAFYALAANAEEDLHCPVGLPEEPALRVHLEQEDIVAGEYDLEALLAHGSRVFEARFNACDGQGRPATTGTGQPRVPNQPTFIRTSGPDANSCSGCHNMPRVGGAGDIVVNAFVLAQAYDPVLHSVDAMHSNERNTLGMFGSGAIEMLTREMTDALHAQVEGLPDGAHVLTAKGIEFPVTISNGRVVDSVGVDVDLIIKPFHQSGVVRSLREFTVNAFNHHHGIQAEERFDLALVTGYNPDWDGDGVERELTVGDVTAVTLYQAALGVPGRVLPKDPAKLARVEAGEQRFADIGCTACHIPEMQLSSRHFEEPYARNLRGTFSDTTQTVSFDMTLEGEGPYLELAPGGGAILRAYTDLKWHNLCDPEDHSDPIRTYCNEHLLQGRPVTQEGRPGTEVFLTRKLWDVGNSDPYGHRGELTTLTEAILAHGGAARASRDAFAGLQMADQADLIRFLRTLQVLPEGSDLVIYE